MLSHSKYVSRSKNHAMYSGSFPYSVDILDDNTMSDSSVQMDFEWVLNYSHNIGFGVSLKRLETQFEYQVRETLPKQRKNHSDLYSLYFQDQWVLNSNTEFNIGYRVSNYSLINKMFSDPRLSLSYQLSDYITLKGTFDKFSQFLHRFSNQFMIGGKKYVWILSNEKLKPIISNHLNGGIQYDDKHILSEITIFFREFDHISDFSRLQFPADVFDENANRNFETQYSLGLGVSKGIELMVQKKTGFIKGWSSYTFGITRHSFPDSSINQGSIFSATHDRTHELKTVLTSSFKNWDFSLSWVFSSGSVFTPNGMKYIENVFPYVVIPDSSFEMNSKRLPFIRKVNVSVTKHFRVLSMNWEMGLSIFNLLDRKNVSHKKYVPAENSDYFVSKNVEMMGITPSFHVKLSL